MAGGDTTAVPIRVLLCDDHGDVRAYLRDALAHAADLEVVGEVGGAREALAAAQRLRPDVLVLDMGMPGVNGLEALHALSATAPETRVVVYSAFSARRLAAPAERLGAVAYVEKHAPVEEVEAAIRRAGTTLSAPPAH